MKTEKIIISVILAGILTFGFAFSLTSFNVASPVDSRSTVNYHSIVSVVKYDAKTGKVTELANHPNLLVNVGKDLVALALNGTAATTTEVYVSNGTTAQLATDTALPGLIGDSGLVHATGTYVYRGVGAWNVTKTFTSTGNSIGVNGTALYSSSILFAETTFTTTTLNANDQLNITWGIYIS